MKKSNKLMLLVQCFFQEYLVIDRGLSPNTVMAYRDTLMLFFTMQCTKQKILVTKLTLDDVNADSVLLFLSQLESERNNTVATRNMRLASIKTFSLFLMTKDIVRAGEYQRIMALPLKKAPHKIIDYLEIDEINAIISQSAANNIKSQRDHTLLKVLYNTGARVQELCDLTVSSITLDHLPVVTLFGKGNKARMVPIWNDTANLLTSYLRERKIIEKPDAKLFLNACGQPIGRFGVRYIIRKYVALAEENCPSLKSKTIGPHTFRHTIAMHLLQAGIDLTVIRSWLGHVSLQTTHSYVEIDMDMKRKVLNTFTNTETSVGLQDVLNKNKDVLTWLASI